MLSALIMNYELRITNKDKYRKGLPFRRLSGYGMDSKSSLE